MFCNAGVGNSSRFAGNPANLKTKSLFYCNDATFNNFEKWRLSASNHEVLATEREPEGQAKRSKAARFFCAASREMKFATFLGELNNHSRKIGSPANTCVWHRSNFGDVGGSETRLCAKDHASTSKRCAAWSEKCHQLVPRRGTLFASIVKLN